MVSGIMRLRVPTRWQIHTGFWVFVLILYTLFFAQGVDRFWNMFVFVALLMPVIIGASYFVNYYLVPAYLLKGRYTSFVVYFLYTLLAAVFMESFIAMGIFLLLADLDIQRISAEAINVRFVLAALLMVILLGLAVKMLAYWRQSREDFERMRREKLEAELMSLRAQLRPHFLFNTLNNLYCLAIEKSDQTPRAILALSELLDAVLHGSEHNLVPLSRELKLVDHYIELELLRCGDRVSVSREVSGSGDRLVPPLFILTLMENAFKHGAGSGGGPHLIGLKVQDVEHTISITVRNTVNFHEKAESRGVGLRNIREQLLLLFPGRHSFEVEEGPDYFQVQLSLVV